jgi:hypothetical protein
VVVHADQAREDAVAGKIEDYSVWRHNRVYASGHGRDSAVLHDECLIGFPWTARSVDDTNVCQRDHRGSCADVRVDV